MCSAWCLSAQYKMYVKMRFVEVRLSWTLRWSSCLSMPAVSSSPAENVSGCCIVTESDTDMEVEYREQADRRFTDNDSISDSNTVNQEDDSFSILDGDSLLEAEGPQPELPPLFIHLTCSINLKSCHGSMPIETLPICLGEMLLPGHDGAERWFTTHGS